MVTSNFIKKNNILRKEFIKKWVNYLLNDKSQNWRNEHSLFINSQIINANNFYNNLIKTKNGYKKIIKKFKITNKTIIKRIEKNIFENEILILKERKKFIKFEN